MMVVIWRGMQVERGHQEEKECMVYGVLPNLKSKTPGPQDLLASAGQGTPAYSWAQGPPS